jgi:hypothetical protein
MESMCTFICRDIRKNNCTYCRKLHENIVKFATNSKINESLAFKRYIHFCLPDDEFQYVRPFCIQLFHMTTLP